MKQALNSFKECIERARHLGGLFTSLSRLVTPVVDTSDLLRAQIVLAVSALDYFIHEITLYGMIQTFEGNRPATDAFLKHKISGSVYLAPTGQALTVFRNDVKERNSFLSFQQPDKIAEAIRMFHGKPLWRGVASRLGSNEVLIKEQLRLIVERRNKVAHEADIDPSFPGARWPISIEDTLSSINFIEQIGQAIFDEVN
ncbi:HEPN domain-containing protein [Comamonas sp.]|uniref:HEPN domain-containing protein n=1 Tax=Comamonas sp. TaxID=34028 RepID=UPI00289F0411|nr:HEPN domain-containing protein [Comamonas sp.]